MTPDLPEALTHRLADRQANWPAKLYPGDVAADHALVLAGQLVQRSADRLPTRKEFLERERDRLQHVQHKATYHWYWLAAFSIYATLRYGGTERCSSQGSITVILFGDCLDRLSHHATASSSMDFAVAFWGRGAGSILGLLHKDGSKRPKGKVRIICNLRLGGTNPDEIRKLLAAGVTVKHDDALHAKVYRFEDVAIVGSANASINGLGFENTEARWFEASSVIDVPQDLEQIDAWFKERWIQAKVVEETDLELAAKNFRRNRARRTRLPEERCSSLIELMHERPEAFEGKRIYLICNLEHYTQEAEEHAKQRTEESGLKIEIYEDWAPPPEAILIDFGWYSYPKGQPRFNGIYRSRRENRPIELNGSQLFEVDFVKQTLEDESPFSITTASIKGQLAEWREIIRYSEGLQSEWDDSGCAITLEQLAWFLKDQDTVPILNVFDELARLEERDGLGVTGNWWRPETLPQVVRVYQKKGGASVAGGVIERRVPHGRDTIIYFRPDDAEKGHPWPKGRFRTNGCLMTLAPKV